MKSVKFSAVIIILCSNYFCKIVIDNVWIVYNNQGGSLSPREPFLVLFTAVHDSSVMALLSLLRLADLA